MIDLGYMAKRISSKPEWLNVPHVRDIYAVSSCISKDFCDYIQYWKHNGFWFFDTPDVIRSISAENKIELADTTLVFYQGYELQFDQDRNSWCHYSPESSWRIAPEPPTHATLLGYDVVTYSTQNSAECSPLSCNLLATEVPVNEHCLIESLDDAIDRLNHGVFNHSEPGPFRIIAVNAVPWPNPA